MDWETLLAITGLYILALFILFHQWIMIKRIIEMTRATKETLESRRQLITKTMKEREKE